MGVPRGEGAHPLCLVVYSRSTVSHTPIYDQVCEDLKLFPRAMKRHSHAQFMRDERQSWWLHGALHRTYGDPIPSAPRPGWRKR